MVAPSILLPTALAQDANPAPAETPQLIEELVVTGSRIRRGNAESAVPLQVFDAQELAAIGTTDLAEALLQLPGVSAAIAPKTSNFQFQTNALSTISLRRLGDDRTLVLINGKRAVSNSGNSDRVSLDTIPIGFVERTEVTTGGASAIYGSDAIAGVANFILEDDFEGIEIDARYSDPDASGGEEERLNLKLGQRFANDRAYVFFAGSYRDEAIVRADSSRPETILAVEFDDPATGSNDTFANEIGAPGCDVNNEDQHCFLGSLSGSTPGGVFEGGDAWFVDGQWFNDQSLQPPDRSGSQDFLADFDGFNFRPGRTLLASREILNLGVTSSFDFTQTTTAAVTVLYSDVDSASATGFETLNNGDGFGVDAFGVIGADPLGNMASDHPFIPPEVEETRSGSVSFGRRLVELGEQARINDRRTVRFMADVTGTLNDRFDWEAFATYGRFKQEQLSTNEYNIQNAQFALDIEDDGAGGFQCADAAARAAGCVPLNIFGEGTISPEAADYIRYNGYAEQVREQYTAGGFITGDIFEMPAGVAKAAFGIEFRREEQDTDGDPDGDLVGGLDGDPSTDDRDLTTLNTFPSVESSYEVIEGYAEIDMPLIENKLNFQAAARIAHYDTIGTIFSYNVGAVWRPIEDHDDFGLRAQYSRAQRAPNLTELFSPPRNDFDGISDPCDGLLPDGTGIDQPEGNGGANADLAVVSANCLSEPGLQAFFSDPDNAGEPFDAPTNAFAPNAGQGVVKIKEETADTFTVGAIYEPRWANGLQLIVDYYRIEIEDAITSVPSQDVVDICYSDVNFPNSRFCDVISRNVGDGEIIQIINFQENLDVEVVEGIDATVRYDFEIPRIAGEWNADLRYTHYLTDEVSFAGIGGEKFTETNLGEINNAENEFRGRLRYSFGGFQLSYTAILEEGGIDDLLNDPNPSDDRFFRAGDEWFHRVFLAYDFGSDSQYRLYGGVNNLSDNLGPLLPTGLDHGSSLNVVGQLNDPIGREYYVGARVRF